jgi:hypothetical protein
MTEQENSRKGVAAAIAAGMATVGVAGASVAAFATNWERIASLPVGRVGGAALTIGAGTLAYTWLRHLYDAVYDRYRAWQRDAIQIHVQRMQAKIQILRPDQYGRQGIAFDGVTYRDLDTMAVYEQALTKALHPLLEEQRWQHAKLQALSHRIPPNSYHYENIIGDQVPAQGQGQLEAGQDPAALIWPKSVPIEDLFRDRSPSINDLVIGAFPTQEGLGVVSDSIYNLMHVLTVGASGWGKSTWLRSFLWQVARAPEPCQVVAIDPKGSEFNVLRGWDRLRWPVARNAETAIEVLRQVSVEIDRRSQLFEQNAPLATNLVDYNQATRADLPPWLVCADEGTYLMNQSGTAEPLRDAVQTARQYGVYIIVSGQSANSKVIETQTRDQFSTRLCFHTSPPSSRTVLDDACAADIHEKGRAWVLMHGRELQEVKGPFVTREQFMAALQRGAPLQAPIGTTQIDPWPAGIDASQVKEIVRRHKKGQSDTRIAREVLGHGNTFYIDKARQVLEIYNNNDNNNNDPPESRGGDTCADNVVVVVDWCEYCQDTRADETHKRFFPCQGCGVAVCSECAPYGLCAECEEDK